MPRINPIKHPAQPASPALSIPPRFLGAAGNRLHCVVVGDSVAESVIGFRNRPGSVRVGEDRPSHADGGEDGNGLATQPDQGEGAFHKPNSTISSGTECGHAPITAKL